MPSNGLDRDFQWQRQFIPEVKRILADYLIDEAPAHEDMRHNTDLVVLELDKIRVACRLRREIGKNGVNYLQRYPDEFTIRALRKRSETELAKMLSGWGDYIFYAFVAADDSRIRAWLLGDLSVFRLWHHREALKSPKDRRWESRDNEDGSSVFHAYRIDDLPDDFVRGRLRHSAVEEVLS